MDVDFSDWPCELFFKSQPYCGHRKKNCKSLKVQLFVCQSQKLLFEQKNDRLPNKLTKKTTWWVPLALCRSAAPAPIRPGQCRSKGRRVDCAPEKTWPLFMAICLVVEKNHWKKYDDVIARPGSTGCIGTWGVDRCLTDHLTKIHREMIDQSNN